MSVSDLIKNAIDKDASGFETSFNNIMADRMTAAIGQKYDSMYGASDVGSPGVSEPEEIDVVEPLETESE